MADKPNILNLDVANAIDDAVSANLNNKFVAMSQDLEKMLSTRMNQMESKFSKNFGNNIHASTSNTGKQIVVLMMTSRLCKFLNFLHHLNPR
jgi:hypothetical protein